MKEHVTLRGQAASLAASCLMNVDSEGELRAPAALIVSIVDRELLIQAVCDWIRPAEDGGASPDRPAVLLDGELKPYFGSADADDTTLLELDNLPRPVAAHDNLRSTADQIISLATSPTRAKDDGSSLAKCRACENLIPAAARRCSFCQVWQDWRRFLYLIFGLPTAALAYISLAAMIPSASSTTLRVVTVDNTGITIAASNRGDRASHVQGAVLTVQALPTERTSLDLQVGPKVDIPGNADRDFILAVDPKDLSLQLPRQEVPTFQNWNLKPKTDPRVHLRILESNGDRRTVILRLPLLDSLAYLHQLQMSARSSITGPITKQLAEDLRQASETAAKRNAYTTPEYKRDFTRVVDSLARLRSHNAPEELQAFRADLTRLRTILEGFMKPELATWVFGDRANGK